MSRFVFYLILLTLPLNHHKSFIFPFSFVGENLVTYLIPKFYFTDILLLVLLLVGLIESRLKMNPSNLMRRHFFVFMFMMFLTISSSFSPNWPTSFYYLLRFFLYASFFFFVVLRVDPKAEPKKISFLLSLPIIFVSTLALLQWLRQGYLLGFVPLGEPLFSATATNAPLVNFFGALKLRSFATFPHSNVLGAFLSITLIWGLNSFLSHLKSKRKKGATLFLTVLVLGVIGLFFSFSQAAWGVFFAGLLSYLLLVSKPTTFEKGKILKLTVVASFFVLALYFIYSLPFEPGSQRRQNLIKISWQLFRENPIFGVGWGNFTKVSPDLWREPVHNIYLLVLAEGGFFSWLFFVLFLLSSFKKSLSASNGHNQLWAVSLLQIILLGFFDHYFLTSQQGNLLFWLVLGLVNSHEGERP